MTIGGPPKPPDPRINDAEVRLTAQVGKEGVSGDYRNKSFSVMMYCKAVLNKPGFELSHFGGNEKFVRLRISTIIKDFPSYTEYMNEDKRGDGIKLEDFLTEKGKKIVARLDEIVTELRSLWVEDIEALDVNRVLELMEEVNKEIDSQKS